MTFPVINVKNSIDGVDVALGENSTSSGRHHRHHTHHYEHANSEQQASELAEASQEEKPAEHHIHHHHHHHHRHHRYRYHSCHHETEKTSSQQEDVPIQEDRRSSKSSNYSNELHSSDELSSCDDSETGEMLLIETVELFPEGLKVPQCYALLEANDTKRINEALSGLTLEEFTSFLTYQDSAGNTPLHVVTSSENCELVKAFLAYGADPTCTNQRGQSPRNIAENSNNPSLKKLFITKKRSSPLCFFPLFVEQTIEPSTPQSQAILT